MTAQHLDDLIAAQRKLLWPLSSQERERRLNEVRADYVYEQQLDAVASAMGSTDPFRIGHDCSNPAGHQFIASCDEVVCLHCARIAWI